MVAETTQQDPKYNMMFAGEPVRIVDREPQSIIQAKIAVMKKCRNVEKNGTNDFHRYKYASDYDVLSLVQPLLAENGLVLNMQMDGLEELEGVQCVRFLMQWLHESGDAGPVVKWLGVASDRSKLGVLGDKWFNKAATAAEKYFLLKQFHIPTGEDADADEAPNKQQQAAQTRSAPKRAEGQRKASPAGKTPDVKLDPAKPEAFPPASDSGPDLKAWGTVFANTIKVAPTVGALDAWFDFNEATLDALQEVGPKLRARLATIHSERAEILSQAEKEAAE